jgi:hypothetical protein
METFTNAAGTTVGERGRQPSGSLGDITTPSARITFVDGSGNPMPPVLQNGVAATVRVRVTPIRQLESSTRRCVPNLLQQPDQREPLR